MNIIEHHRVMDKEYLIEKERKETKALKEKLNFTVQKYFQILAESPQYIISKKVLPEFEKVFLLQYSKILNTLLINSKKQINFRYKINKKDFNEQLKKSKELRNFISTSVIQDLLNSQRQIRENTIRLSKKDIYQYLQSKKTSFIYIDKNPEYKHYINSINYYNDKIEQLFFDEEKKISQGEEISPLNRIKNGDPSTSFLNNLFK